MDTLVTHVDQPEIASPEEKTLFFLSGHMVRTAMEYVKRVDGVEVSEQTMQEALIKAIELSGCEVWR